MQHVLEVHSAAYAYTAPVSQISSGSSVLFWRDCVA